MPPLASKITYPWKVASVDVLKLEGCPFFADHEQPVSLGNGKIASRCLHPGILAAVWEPVPCALQIGMPCPLEKSPVLVHRSTT